MSRGSLQTEECMNFAVRGMPRLAHAFDVCRPPQAAIGRKLGAHRITMACQARAGRFASSASRPCVAWHCANSLRPSRVVKSPARASQVSKLDAAACDDDGDVQVSTVHSSSIHQAVQSLALPHLTASSQCMAPP